MMKHPARFRVGCSLLGEDAVAAKHRRFYKLPR